MDSQYYEQSYVDTPVTTDEIYGRELQNALVRNIVAQINPDQQRFEIEMMLRGFKKNWQTDEWEKRQGVPEVKELLIDDFMAYLSSIMNQSTSLSNLTDGEINNIMRQAIEWIADSLEDEKYGINSYNERSRIGHIILNPMFIVMKRALFGQESKRMWKSINLNETGNPQSEQKKGGWMDALKFWK